MISAWLLLLLPIAAVSGWFSARKHYKARYGVQNNGINPEYFKGINYLLDEQPDKAIDVFIRLLEVNSDTVETHFALANLFRRRGETDRAIRIHQNLIARPALPPTQRSSALFELGMDYMHAGLLDRAEELFLELISKKQHISPAHQQLLKIYQQEKSWAQAISTAQTLQASGEPNMGTFISQFYCELAEQDPHASTNDIRQLLRKAHSNDANCVRASLCEAKLLIAADDHRKARKVLQHIEQQNNEYIPEALPLLLTCHTALGSLPKFESWLSELLERYPEMTAARLMLAELLKQEHGPQAMQDYLNQALRKHPSVEGLHSLLSLGQNDNPDLIPLIEDVTRRLIKLGYSYTCVHCGFAGKTLHWLCPGCGQWGSIRPTEIHLSALETLRERKS